MAARGGVLRKYLNKLIVFIVSGLWHGASFAFIVWGGVNGLYQIIGETLKPIRERLIQIFHLNKYSLFHKILNCAVTFVLITFSWIFFRAGEWFKATEVIKSMVKVHNPWILFDGSLYTI